jgi:arylsulfatase
MAWSEDIARYKGKYKAGYETIRKARYEKQLKMGLIDRRYPLSASTHEPWESLSPEQKAIEERKMEVYAAMIDRMDQNIGKVLDKLREQGKLDNTIILFMSDNGASAEVVTLDYGYGEIGSLTNWTSLCENWANVCNTPFRYYKNYSYEGGIATPLIISWNQGLKTPNRISNFTGHFIDIMATFVDLTGAEYPTEYKRKQVLPYEGVSLMPVVRNEKAERTKPIFWEWQNGQAVKDGKWKLVRDGLKNKWSLFDMSVDPVEVNDLAEKYPQQVEKMEQQFKEWQQRVKN